MVFKLAAAFIDWSIDLLATILTYICSVLHSELEQFYNEFSIG